MFLTPAKVRQLQDKAKFSFHYIRGGALLPILLHLSGVEAHHRPTQHVDW